MFFVAKICKCALRASIEGYLAVAASTPTYSSLAPSALVRLFPSVRHNVESKIASLIGRKVALRALVLLFPSVGEQMSLQV